MSGLSMCGSGDGDAHVVLFIFWGIRPALLRPTLVDNQREKCSTLPQLL